MSVSPYTSIYQTCVYACVFFFTCFLHVLLTSWWQDKTSSSIVSTTANSCLGFVSEGGSSAPLFLPSEIGKSFKLACTVCVLRKSWKCDCTWKLNTVLLCVIIIHSNQLQDFGIHQRFIVTSFSNLFLLRNLWILHGYVTWTPREDFFGIPFVTSKRDLVTTFLPT